MTVTGRLRLYLPLVVVGAVLYSLAGPLLDHHYAERLPFHGHLYLSELPRAHTHFYVDPSGNPGTSHQRQDILFLPGTDIQYTPDGFAWWAWLTSSPWLMLAPVLLTILIELGPHRRPLSAVVAPPHKPPRLAA